MLQMLQGVPKAGETCWLPAQPEDCPKCLASQVQKSQASTVEEETGAPAGRASNSAAMAVKHSLRRKRIRAEQSVAIICNYDLDIS